MEKVYFFFVLESRLGRFPKQLERLTLTFEEKLRRRSHAFLQIIQYRLEAFPEPILEPPTPALYNLLTNTPTLFEQL